MSLKDELTPRWALQTIAVLIWMVCFGTQIEISPLIQKMKNPKGIFIGLFMQVAFLPLWTFALIKMLGVEGLVAVAFITVGCSPGGTASNMWCLIIDLDITLSAAMTGVSTFLAAAAMPFNIWLYGRNLDAENDIPFFHIIIPAVTVVLGTGTGMYIRYRGLTEETVATIDKATKVFALILVIVAMINIFRDEKPKLDFTAGEWMMALLMNGTTLIFGTFAGRLVGLTKQEAGAIGIEVSTQNLLIPLIIFENGYESHNRVIMISTMLLFAVWSFLQNLIYAAILIKLGWTYRGLSAEERSRATLATEITDEAPAAGVEKEMPAKVSVQVEPNSSSAIN